MPLSHCDTWIVDRQWAYSVQRVPDCLGGLSRVGISSRSTRPWNGQPPSTILRQGSDLSCWYNLGSLCQNTTDLHAGPGIPAAEKCATVWSRSPHVKKVDVAINSSLRIAPAGLRRKAATLASARKEVKTTGTSCTTRQRNKVPPCRLMSRKPYNKEAQEIQVSSLRTGRMMRGLRNRGSRSGKHPDTPEYIATYRAQEKASREVWAENTGRL